MINKLLRVFYHINLYIFKSNKEYVKFYWFNKVINFGDSVNPYLVEQISKKKVLWVSPKYTFEEHYLVIGSIINDSRSNSVIWGSGFISDKPKKIDKFLKICAVRGPKSRQLYLDHGIECPEIYGDPALLLPRFYTSNVSKKYKIGIIPHYVDKNNLWLQNFLDIDTVKIIDIQEKNPLKFIDEVNECEVIISSSLHGLIVADAYNIPSIWIQLSSQITGNNFKFYDYFESVGRKDEVVCVVSQETTLEEILKYKKNYSIDIDLDRLLDACPFKNV